MPAQDAIASLQKAFPGKVGQPKEFRGDHTVDVDKEIIRDVATHLKQLGLNFIVDISSVDHFGSEPRYEMVYEFCAIGGEHDESHVRVKTKVSEDEPSLDSIVPVYQGADWHEREVFDMMSIKFNGHPDLRRILMWDGYPFYPLKKDFPLEGLPSDLPGEEGFSRRAPLEGGPFVASPTDKPQERGEASTAIHEPRARPADHEGVPPVPNIIK